MGVLLSLHLLQTRCGAPAFARWRQRTLPRLDGRLRGLLALAPPRSRPNWNCGPRVRTVTYGWTDAGCVSPAMATHHTAILREAGLIASNRTGGSVHHTLRSLGEALLRGDQEAG
ncbi:helix-turn-helix domain-containing protein [Streptomyces sirii]|uniref:helix-turn-helix domain-containing protein n=1 Tax=Streptomyces sirii TaxID=3127701 RepID=UPI003D35DBA2